MASAFRACLVVLLAMPGAWAHPSEPAAGSSIITLPLEKQHVPVKKGDRIMAWKTAYFGSIYAGGPKAQKFTVVFDTGSGHLILPHVACSSPTCTMHRRYDSRLSETAQEIEHDGSPVPLDAIDRDQVSVNFGTGRVTGEFVEETICLGGSLDMSKGGRNCARVRLVVGTEMSQDPFELFTFDGVMGLGLNKLVMSPEFSFTNQLVTQKPDMLPIFAVYLDAGEGQSEIAFGGHNPQRLAPGATLHWMPVASPEVGYWQLAVNSIKIGNTTLDLCKDGACRAIMDTGTSILGVPKAASRDIHWMLARSMGAEDKAGIDCRHVPGPVMTFDIGGFPVELGAWDYSRPAMAQMKQQDSNETEFFCRGTLLPVDMKPPMSPKVFIFGEPVLRRYYIAFNRMQQEIGLGRSAGDPHASTEAGSDPCEPKASGEVDLGCRTQKAGAAVAGAPPRAQIPEALTV